MSEKKKYLLTRDVNNRFGSDWIRLYPDTKKESLKIQKNGFWPTHLHQFPFNGIEEFRLSNPFYKGKIPRKGRCMEVVL